MAYTAVVNLSNGETHEVRVERKTDIRVDNYSTLVDPLVYVGEDLVVKSSYITSIIFEERDVEDPEEDPEPILGVVNNFHYTPPAMSLDEVQQEVRKHLGFNSGEVANPQTSLEDVLRTKEWHNEP